MTKITCNKTKETKEKQKRAKKGKEIFMLLVHIFYCELLRFLLHFRETLCCNQIWSKADLFDLWKKIVGVEIKPSQFMGRFKL